MKPGDPPNQVFQQTAGAAAAGAPPPVPGAPVSGAPQTESAIEVAVEHTRGSAARPLTDEELLAKVRALFGPVLGEAAADRARDAVDKLPGAEDTAELLTALRPSREASR